MVKIEHFWLATIVAKDFASAERSLKSLLYSRPNHGLGQRNFNSNKKENPNVGADALLILKTLLILALRAPRSKTRTLRSQRIRLKPKLMPKH
jgi:hypothetical protein